MKQFEFPDFELLALDVSDIVATSNPFEDPTANNELIGWNWN